MHAPRSEARGWRNDAAQTPTRTPTHLQPLNASVVAALDGRPTLASCTSTPDTTFADTEAIATRFGFSPADCCVHCAAFRDCVAWTLDLLGATCSLHGATSHLSRLRAVGRVSGIRPQEEPSTQRQLVRGRASQVLVLRASEQDIGPGLLAYASELGLAAAPINVPVTLLLERDNTSDARPRTHPQHYSVHEYTWADVLRFFGYATWPAPASYHSRSPKYNWMLHSPSVIFWYISRGIAAGHVWVVEADAVFRGSLAHFVGAYAGDAASDYVGRITRYHPSRRVARLVAEDERRQRNGAARDQRRALRTWSPQLAGGVLVGRC